MDGNVYQVHHRFTLEFAHLAVDSDVNAVANLAAVEVNVHRSVNRVWSAFRAARRAPSLAEVQEVEAIVDRRYGRWYNVVYDRIREQAALNEAQASALAELRAALSRWGTP